MFAWPDDDDDDGRPGPGYRDTEVFICVQRMMMLTANGMCHKADH